MYIGRRNSVIPYLFLASTHSRRKKDTAVARKRHKEDLDEIITVVRDRSCISSSEIASLMGSDVKYRTLQYRLKRLVEDGRLQREGDDRWARYRLAEPESGYCASVLLSRGLSRLRDRW